MNNDTQRSWRDSHFDRRLANIFPVSVDIERPFGFDSQTGGLKIFHFPHAQVISKVDGRKEAKKLERIDVADDAKIEFAVVEPCSWRDFHAAAIRGRVGEGREHSWLAAAWNQHFGIVGRRHADLHGKRRELKERASETDDISALGP